MAQALGVIGGVGLRTGTPNNFMVQVIYQLDTGVSDTGSTAVDIAFADTDLSILDALRAAIKTAALSTFSVTLADSDIRIFPF